LVSHHDEIFLLIPRSLLRGGFIRHGLPGNVNSTICQEIQRAVTTTVKSALEPSLEEELTQYLGLARYEHLPWGRRPE
jgi:hypothetical protein